MIIGSYDIFQGTTDHHGDDVVVKDTAEDDDVIVEIEAEYHGKGKAGRNGRDRRQRPVKRQ